MWQPERVVCFVIGFDTAKHSGGYEGLNRLARMNNCTTDMITFLDC